MFDVEFIRKLKQTNVSVDSEKTKERVKQLWKDASSELKQQIVVDADVKRATIYRIYHTGSISARLTVAFAQKLNVDPYYLSGEKDEIAECSDDALDRFLRDKGYSKQIDDAAAVVHGKRQNRSRRNSSGSGPNPGSDTVSATSNQEITNLPTYAENFEDSEKPAESEPVSQQETTDPQPSATNLETLEKPAESEPVPQHDLDTLTADDLSVLLRALFVRARIDENAAKNLDKVRNILIH